MAPVLVFLDIAAVGSDYPDDKAVRQDIPDGRIPESAVPAVGNFCGLFELWGLVVESVRCRKAGNFDLISKFPACCFLDYEAC